MPAAALGLCRRFAHQPLPNHITRNEHAPRTKNAEKLTRKMRRACRSRPSVFASDTIFDSATGSPAVEIINSIE